MRQLHYQQPADHKSAGLLFMGKGLIDKTVELRKNTLVPRAMDSLHSSFEVHMNRFAPMAPKKGHVSDLVRTSSTPRKRAGKPGRNAALLAANFFSLPVGATKSEQLRVLMERQGQVKPASRTKVTV
jgi:hypothetical protein